MNLASSRRNWPTGRGFERFYGFLGAETNQWYPELVYDSHPVDPPRTPQEGYHLTEDLTDKALEFIKDAKVLAPEKPFFLYYAPGACHAPHHAPREWIDRFKGRFDMGYEALREQTLARQKQMGIVPPGTELPPINPIGTPETRTGPNGEPFPALDYTRPWDSLTARGAAAVQPHGRGLRRLPGPHRRADRPAAGPPRGDGPAARTRSSSWSPTTAPAARAARTDRSTSTCSPTGSRTTWPRTWPSSTTSAARRRTTTTRTAGRWRSTRRSRCGSATSSTAARRTRASSPGRRASRPGASCASSTTTPSTSCRRSSTRSASSRPRRSAATPRATSTASACATASTPRRCPAPARRSSTRCSARAASGTQGWKAVSTHPTLSGWGHFEKDTWELYHTDTDRSELHDLAAAEPERLQALVSLWYAEAGANGGFPLDDRSRAGDHPDAAAAALAGAQPLRLLPRRRRRARVPGGQHPQPLLRHRRGRRHPRRRAPRACCSRTARASAATRSTSRTTGCTTSTASSAASSRRSSPTEELPTGEQLILSAAFDKDGRGPARRLGRHALAVPRRREGRGGPDQDPARQVLARRAKACASGATAATRVTGDYPGGAPWAFTGGTIDRVAVDVSGEPYVDLEREAVAMMSRE